MEYAEYKILYKYPKPYKQIHFNSLIKSLILSIVQPIDMEDMELRI